MNRSYLLLGSNQGNSLALLEKARHHIEKSIGIILRCSAIYRTAAWGKEDQPDFLNQVLIVETSLGAIAILSQLLSIEKKMGRLRTTPNAPRKIDIDILFFNKEIIRKKELKVPHPRMADRRFVLVPLNELSPRLIHPVLQQTIHHLLRDCRDTLDVKKF